MLLVVLLLMLVRVQGRRLGLQLSKIQEEMSLLGKKLIILLSNLKTFYKCEGCLEFEDQWPLEVEPGDNHTDDTIQQTGTFVSDILPESIQFIEEALRNQLAQSSRGEDIESSRRIHNTEHQPFVNLDENEEEEPGLEDLEGSFSEQDVVLDASSHLEESLPTPAKLISEFDSIGSFSHTSFASNQGATE